jgi:hypothetical protein
MFGRKPKGRTVNIEATVAVNNAIREFELTGDARDLCSVLGGETAAQVIPNLRQAAAVVAADDDPTKEGK